MKKLFLAALIFVYVTSFGQFYNGTQDYPITGQSAQTATINNIIPSTASSSGTYVVGYRSFTCQIKSTGTGGTFIFEGSNDNTTYNPIVVFNSALVIPVPIVTAITATSSSITYTGAINVNYIRVRIATTITGGNIQAYTKLIVSPLSNTIQVVGNGTAANHLVTASIASAQTLATVTTLTGGSTAEDAATSSSPHIVGGIARTALPATTVVAGDAVRNTMSTSGQLVVKPYAVSDLEFYANATVTTNTQTAIRAAQGASIRQYVTGVTYQNTNATATTLTIQDGSTTLITFSCPASMTNPVQLTFPTPLKGTANTALNYTAGTTGANVLLNVTGYNGY